MYFRILRWVFMFILWLLDVVFNVSEDGMNVSWDLYWLLSFIIFINELWLDDNFKYLC